MREMTAMALAFFGAQYFAVCRSKWSIMKKFLYVLDHIEESLAGFALLLMALLYFLEVVLRYVFSNSLAWIEEFLRYSMVFITFFGASVAIKYSAHMSVNIIEFIPSKPLKRAIELFIPLLGIVFSAWLVYLSWLLMLRIKGFGQQTPAMQIPMYIPYSILPLGFASMFIRFAIQLINRLKPAKSA